MIGKLRADYEWRIARFLGLMYRQKIQESRKGWKERRCCRSRAAYGTETSAIAEGFFAVASSYSTT